MKLAARVSAQSIVFKKRAWRISPIGLHHFPLGVTTEMLQHRMGDFYMLGHGNIGSNAKKAGIFEAAKAPFMMRAHSSNPHLNAIQGSF